MTVNSSGPSAPKHLPSNFATPQVQSSGVGEAAKTAGAAVAKGAGAAASAVQSQTDKFGSAKIGADASKSTPQGFMAGGCCMPPPGGKFPGGVLENFDLKGWQLKNDATKAKDNFNKTADKAESVFSQGGNQITDKEQRGINSAGRDWKIADKKVDLHEAQEAHKKARTEARADGSITDAEQARLNAGQSKIDKLQGELTGLQKADKTADQNDKFADLFDNIKPQPKPFPGFPGPDFKLPDIGPGGKPPGLPGLPDFKLPDLKPNPGDFKLPEGRPFPFPDFKLPDLPPLPFPFPSLPNFPKLPSFDFKPFLLQAFKLW